MGTLFLALLLVVSIFLMFVVLIQRGRGGGLAGAFGGAGGQSAFGTKAGDLFTWITVWTGIVWVLLAILASWRLRVENEGSFVGGTDTQVEAGAAADAKKKKDADDALPEPENKQPAEAVPQDDKTKPAADAKKVNLKPATGTSAGATTPAEKARPAEKPTASPPVKADSTPPTKPVPAKSEPTKTEPAKTEPAKTETKK